MKRAALVLAALALAAGCAKYPRPDQIARNDLYILLPATGGGSAGALTVTHANVTRTLDRPHAAAKIDVPGRIDATVATEAEVKGFGAALGAQPPRPTSFFLYFLLDSDELTPESQRLVGDVIADIAKRPVPEVVVIGHTDTIGTEEYNDRLSQQRAGAVRERLIARGIGIPPSSIFATGRGKRELLVPTGDQVAEPKNRRVEILVR